MRNRVFEITLLFIILALAAGLRFTNLSDNPGWYTDEATHVNIAHNLLQGRIQYLAINQSTLLFARPPLFHVVLAGWFRLFGEGIASLRTLTASLGVFSTGLLYLVLRRMQIDRVLPLLAALMFALYPQAILYSRFGFSYNLLVPLLLLALFGLHSYITSASHRWLILSSLSIGLGITSDLMMLAFLPVLILLVLARTWRHLGWGKLLAALPFLLYAAAMLLTVPSAFLFDLHFTLSRLSALSPLEQLENIALNYTTLISQDFWMLAGIMGLFLLQPVELRNLSLLLFGLPLIVMGRTVALYGLSAYYMIPLMPFVALGVASLLRSALPYVLRKSRDILESLLRAERLKCVVTLGAYALAALTLVSPFVVTLVLTVNQVRGGYPTAIDPFLINPADARSVAAYINAHASPDDVVIASPAVGWQLASNVADFQMAVAYTGEATPHLPGDIPSDRWAFNPSFTSAKWVIVDNLWRNWGAAYIPGVAKMIAEIEANWPMVFEAGAIQVYQNPDMSR